jgi:hypothetical protein
MLSESSAFLRRPHASTTKDLARGAAHPEGPKAQQASRSTPRSRRRWVDPSDPVKGPALAADYHSLLEALAPIAVPLDHLLAALRGTAAQWARTRLRSGDPAPRPTPSSAPPREAPSHSRRRRRRGRPPPPLPFSPLRPAATSPATRMPSWSSSSNATRRQRRRQALRQRRRGRRRSAGKAGRPCGPGPTTVRRRSSPSPPAACGQKLLPSESVVMAARRHSMTRMTRRRAAAGMRCAKPGIPACKSANHTVLPDVLKTFCGSVVSGFAHRTPLGARPRKLA